jgi:hypothetical protein
VAEFMCTEYECAGNIKGEKCREQVKKLMDARKKKHADYGSGQGICTACVCRLLYNLHLLVHLAAIDFCYLSVSCCSVLHWMLFGRWSTFL